MTAERNLKVQAEDVEKSFRDSLDDLILVTEKLSPFCSSPSEMVEVLRLAQSNDMQLRILMNQVTAGKR